jgi:tight adherence protein B
MTPELLTIGIAGLAFIAIVGVGFAFAGGDRGKQSKRIRAIGEGVSRKGKDDVNALRRKQMADATKAPPV